MRPLTSRNPIRQAFDAFSERLRRDAQEFRREVGYQGGGGSYPVYWRPEERFWSLLELADNRYWCCFGLENPNSQNSLTIVCEINPPLEGINRRCAGFFVEGDDGCTNVAHSGKIGGGKPGIGKQAFERSYSGTWQTVRWPDGVRTRAVVIGAVDGENLPAEIRDFILQVQQIKQKAVV